MRISAGLKERFNRAGLFTTSQLVEATGLTAPTVMERARDPKVRRQHVGKMTFIDARTFALMLDDSAVLRAAVMALLKKYAPTVSVVAR